MGYGKKDISTPQKQRFWIIYFSYFQGENPIYKQATSTFKNPTYNGGR